MPNPLSSVKSPATFTGSPSDLHISGNGSTDPLCPCGWMRPNTPGIPDVTARTTHIPDQASAKKTFHSFKFHVLEIGLVQPYFECTSTAIYHTSNTINTFLRCLGWSVYVKLLIALMRDFQLEKVMKMLYCKWLIMHVRACASGVLAASACGQLIHDVDRR